MNDSEKARQKIALNEAIEQILDQDNPHAYSMIAAVRRWLRQFGLDSRTEPAEILIQSYLRGLRTTDKGKPIQNCRAWIKGTARYIIRELSRQQELPTDPQAAILDKSSVSENCCENNCDRNFAILWEAFELLRVSNPDIAELMDLRILKELSWSEIRQHLLERDNEPPSEETLRQRATRAKRKLRRLFHELGGEYEPLHPQ